MKGKTEVEVKPPLKTRKFVVKSIYFIRVDYLRGNRVTSHPTEVPMYQWQGS